jgi:diguanylate cyclase (GGDEF)-like protein
VVSISRLRVSTRFLIVLGLGLIAQASISVAALVTLRHQLIEDRASEVKHLDEAAYTSVAFYYERASTGLMSVTAAQQAARDVLRSMRFDRTNYFCAWDLNGNGVIHGSVPALEGKNLLNPPYALKLPYVSDMVRKLLVVAANPEHEGFASYRMTKLGQKTLFDKLAYSKLFKPWGWVITTGAYLDDIDATFWAQARRDLAIALCAIGGAGLLSVILAQDLSRALRRVSRSVQEVAGGALDGEVPDIDRGDEVGVMARALLALRDTSREAAELRLDQLTGVPSRKLLMDRLRRINAEFGSRRRLCAVMLVDLDKFKSLNDTHGHDVGDALLIEVAQRLTACVHPADTVARLGGDEFVVVLSDLGDTPDEAARNAESVAQRILAVLGEPYQLGLVKHRGSASIGVTLITGDGASPEMLLKRADLAMYKSKESGQGLCQFFDAEMAEARQARDQLEADLRKALERDEFLLLYQPQIGLGGTMSAAEALIRWRHPQRGMVLPDAFIPLAEETGLILPIGHWVLESACRQLAVWSERSDMADCNVAINVSAVQFRQPDFVAQVLETLARFGVAPNRLTLELTESLLIENLDHTVEKISRLKLAGVRFALDDFGTGYSSIHLLKRLPLDQLKIDRSYIRDVTYDPNAAAIVNMMVTLGRTLGLEIVAEGIETAEQQACLLNMNSHTSQGNFFSEPLTIESFERFARAQRVSAVA